MVKKRIHFSPHKGLVRGKVTAVAYVVGSYESAGPKAAVSLGPIPEVDEMC